MTGQSSGATLPIPAQSNSPTQPTAQLVLLSGVTQHPHHLPCTRQEEATIIYHRKGPLQQRPPQLSQCTLARSLRVALPPTGHRCALFVVNCACMGTNVRRTPQNHLAIGSKHAQTASLCYVHANTPRWAGGRPQKARLGAIGWPGAKGGLISGAEARRQAAQARRQAACTCVPAGRQLLTDLVPRGTLAQLVHFRNTPGRVRTEKQTCRPCSAANPHAAPQHRACAPLVDRSIDDGAATYIDRCLSKCISEAILTGKNF